MPDLKVTSAHLERDAYLYIRQSTPRQVLEHQESTQRQYGLRQQALRLGWPEDKTTIEGDRIVCADIEETAEWPALLADAGRSITGHATVQEGRAHVTSFCAEVADCVNRIHPQCIDVKIAKPHQCIFNEIVSYTIIPGVIKV